MIPKYVPCCTTGRAPLTKLAPPPRQTSSLTLPVLLANLTTIGQVAVTYNASLETLLVVLAARLVAFTQASPARDNHPMGMALGGVFGLGSLILHPAPLVFLPPVVVALPQPTRTTIDTPDGLYCQACRRTRQFSVRGLRKYPLYGCAWKACNRLSKSVYSDKPYSPLAMRQHATGPYPFDPNLASQGIPPDSRVTNDDHIFGAGRGVRPARRLGAAPRAESEPSRRFRSTARRRPRNSTLFADATSRSRRRASGWP